MLSEFFSVTVVPYAIHKSKLFTFAAVVGYRQVIIGTMWRDIRRGNPAAIEDFTFSWPVYRHYMFLKGYFSNGYILQENFDLSKNIFIRKFIMMYRETEKLFSVFLVNK